MKKKKYIIVCSALLLALGVGVTFAFLQQRSNSLTNTFKVAEVDTEIDEPDMQPDGADIKKEPSVKNTGESDAIVRVRCVISPEEMFKGEEINYNDTEEEYNAELNSDHKKVRVEGNWEKGNDGYWYYQGVIPSGKYTEPLFTKIEGVLIKNADDTYSFEEGYDDFEITVYQEAVQATVHDGDETLSAIDENGKYDQTKAMKIWEKFNSTKITK